MSLNQTTGASRGWIRALHKWLMLFIGLQFLIWTVTGLYMVLVNIHFIHGESLAETQTISAHQLQNHQIPADVLQHCQDAQSASVVPQLNRPVLVCRDTKSVMRLDWQTQTELGPVTEQEALRIASERFSGAEAVTSIKYYQDRGVGEVSPRHLPYWRIEFDGYLGATFYVSAQSGEVVSKRHHFWRAFDWMWRFHIMDYDDGENVKNGLLTVLVVAALVTFLSGTVLLFQRGRAEQKQSSPWFVKYHRIFAALAALQFGVWIITGGFFNLLDGKEYSANTYRQSTGAEMNMLALRELEIPNGDFQQIDFTAINNKTYAVFWQFKGQHTYQPRSAIVVEAINNKVTKIDSNLVANVAESSYSGPGQIIDVTLLSAHDGSFPQQENPFWRISFDDEIETKVYVDSVDGRVLKHSNQGSELKALMLKLHFMDYFNQGGFNHVLIYVFAFLAFGQVVTGAVWVVKLIGNSQYKIQRQTARKQVNIVVNKKPSVWSLSTGLSLFSALRQQNAFMPSSCQGAGTCGHCLFLSDTILPVTDGERQLLSENKLNQGYRLACQHNVESIQTCEIKTLKVTAKD